MGFYYLKYAHHPDANVKNEIETIGRLENLPVPRIVEYDDENYRYEVTAQLEGRRLSVILAERGTENGTDICAIYESR